MTPVPGIGADLHGTDVPLSETERAVALAVSHSTHLEALAWAAGRAGPGAVLEIGSGWYSTPWLHGWCEATGRWLLTVETEPEWELQTRALYSAPFHEVRWQARGFTTLPQESFALALVDGVNEDRAGWLRRLAETQTLTVVHDTESSRVVEFPAVEAALAAFDNRREFARVFPHTTVVWNGGP